MVADGGRADVADTIAAIRRLADDLHETNKALYVELDKLAELTGEDEGDERDRPGR